MSGWDAFVTVLQIVAGVWTYLTSKNVEKANAAQKLADLFVKVEDKGHPIMKDLLTRMGRSHWVPWDQVPGPTKQEEKP